jgi:tRNA(Ile)-lysidine synthase
MKAPTLTSMSLKIDQLLRRRTHLTLSMQTVCYHRESYMRELSRTSPDPNSTMLSSMPVLPLRALASTGLPSWVMRSPTVFTYEANHDPGIALSGGADSMALTFLCYQLTVTHPRVPLNIHAFIVDHGARPESTDEAWRIKGVLWKLHIQSRILTLNWPNDGNPSKLPNFETQARELRYRAMGTACAEMGIEHLLLGHHADDQVESILMRLIKGARGVGLASISVNSPIPSCNSVFGARESGRFLTLDGLKKKLPQDMSTPIDGKSLSPIRTLENFKISDGGVTICRPLLPFTKSQILSTCDFYRIPFEVDKTNFDRTFSIRNAIRYLVKERELPRALQPGSMLSLAERKRSILDQLEEHSNKLLESTLLLKFDTIGAFLEIRLPSLKDLPTDFSKEWKKWICTLYLRRLTSLINPSKHKPALSHFEPAVSKLFPELADSPPDFQDVKFTTGDLLFDRCGNDNNTSDVVSSGNLQQTWRISTQPYTRKALKEVIIPIPPLPPKTASVFFRFGGNFWIRLFNSSHKQAIGNLIMRPLKPDDLSYIRSRLSDKSLRLFENLVPPGHVRFTIPVVLSVSGQQQHYDREKSQAEMVGNIIDYRNGVILLPTMGLGASPDGDALPVVKAEVAYRKIDTEVLGLLLKKPREVEGGKGMMALVESNSLNHRPRQTDGFIASNYA